MLPRAQAHGIGVVMKSPLDSPRQGSRDSPSGYRCSDVAPHALVAADQDVARGIDFDRKVYQWIWRGPGFDVAVAVEPGAMTPAVDLANVDAAIERIGALGTVAHPVTRIRLDPLRGA